MDKDKNETKFKISKKLFNIAKLVEGDFVVDVGCDHGKLSIYLALYKDVKKIYACDVRKKPLEKARENAKKYNVFEKIEFLLSDGLQKVPRFVDCVVVAGLGGKTIAKIIFKESFIRNKKVKLILQPQSFLYLFRYNLYLNGFKIEKEVHLIENGKFYDILVVSFFKDMPFIFKEDLKIEDIDSRVVLGELSKNNVYSSEFLKALTLKEFKILKGLEKAKGEDFEKKEKQRKIFSILKKSLGN